MEPYGKSPIGSYHPQHQAETPIMIQHHEVRVPSRSVRTVGKPGSVSCPIWLAGFCGCFCVLLFIAFVVLIVIIANQSNGPYYARDKYNNYGK